MGTDPTLRFRIDFGARCSVGVGKVELLEGIARSGSLAQAARDMHMSYRRAWLLLADLNVSFDQPVATATVGGRGGGGVVLTAFGMKLIDGYRGLESSLQPLVSQHLLDVGRQVKRSTQKRGVRAASLKKKAARELRAG
jgi:molybdate transport system regulatory protein